MKIDIAGVFVDSIDKSETIPAIEEFVRSGKPHHVVTTYSEFVVFAQKDPEFKNVLSRAALSLPDGIGMLWAAKYLSLPAHNRIQALWQIVYTGASLIFVPSYSRSVIKERISGNRLIWDIAKLCSKNGFSLSLVGGFGGVAEKSAKTLKSQFPLLEVKIAQSGRKFDQQLIYDIAQSNTDILLIAYQPPKQEKWLSHNLSELKVKVAIGLGGTFDYVAGTRRIAPLFIGYFGLEWLWRLITQPWRIKRMWNAIIIFIVTVYKFKISKINL